MSLLTTTPTPAKVKDFLASVKEQILNPFDQEEEPSVQISVATLGILLIRMELIQRGVLLNNTSLLAGDDEIPKAWESVRVAAGKSLLSPDQSSSLPKPLLAGSSAIAGRIAELISANHEPSVSVSVIPSTNLDAYQSALNRCQEVQDDRLRGILQLLVTKKTNHPADVGDDDASKLAKQIALCQLAEGYYLRAASIQPNAPPMWKKAWDMQVKMQHLQQNAVGDETSEHIAEPSESSVPLIQLIRIAKSKGNTKRVSELSLHLAESYLTAATETTTRNSKELHQLIQQSFIQPHLDESSVSHYGNLADCAEKARGAIQECTVEDLGGLDNANEALFWHTLLNFRIALARQDGQIQQEAQTMHTSMQNRGSLSATDSASSQSIGACSKKAREQVLSEAAIAMDTQGSEDDNISKAVHETAQLLQTKLLERIGTDNAELRPLDIAAIDLIRLYHFRLQDQAKSVGLVLLSTAKKGKKNKATAKSDGEAKGIKDYGLAIASWRRLLQFLHPIMRQAQTNSGWLSRDPLLSNSPESMRSWLLSRAPNEKQLVSSAVTLFSSALWMVLPVLSCYNSDTLATLEMVLSICFQEDMVNFSSNLLASMLLQLEQEKKNVEEEKTTAVVETVMTDLEKEIVRLQAARASSSCLVSVGATTGPVEGPARQQLVQEAISSYRKSQSSSSSTSNQPTSFESLRLAQQGEFGVAYCQCMIAWSGLHSLPWSTCTVSDARLLVTRAHGSLESATSDWGRESTFYSPACPSLERLLLEVANADIMLECGGVGAPIPCFVDNFTTTSGVSTEVEPTMKRYMAILEALQVMSESSNSSKENYSGEELALLRIHCFYGLAKVSSRGDQSDGASQSAESLALKGLQLAIDSLQKIDETEYLNDRVRNASMWTCPTGTICKESFRHQISMGRQLVADALILSGRLEHAESFLIEAVQDAPADAEAAFALGAFLLQRVLYYGRYDASSPTANDVKAAQIQLLKAAKLDPTKANPFALLGLWFERQNDMKRAQGCYAKALVVDPPNPIAGRGLLRLFRLEGLEQQEIDAYLDTAVNANSSVNGWAWRAVGERKATEANDELAVVALIKALRCRDIEGRQQEALGVFYSMPAVEDLGDPSNHRSFNEKAETLAELAMCYRRLGRYTAAIRSFYGARESAGELVPSSVLFSCAQVELELGLFDEAAENYLRVLDRRETSTHAIASYGLGVALLAIAQRDLQDGKAGAAFDHVRKAIQSCSSVTHQYGCISKLLGDLHSFGAALPPGVFQNEAAEEGNSSGEDLLLRAKLQFIALGEDAYRSAVDLQPKMGDDDIALARACFICDIGANILLQGVCLSEILGSAEGSDFACVSHIPDVADCYSRAAQEFRNAIEVAPLHAPAWCGLGCAVATSDPLLSQHAFCRCLELDKMFADSYANLGLLYVSNGSLAASETVMDSLTQVADTPFMWINRALMLERSVINNPKQDMLDAGRKISRASDAYRAALQVMRHPSAVLGLSLTCRMEDSHGSRLHNLCRKDGFAHMMEYIGLAGSMNRAAVALGGVMTMEKGAMGTSDWNKDVIEAGRNMVETAIAPNDLDGILDLEVVGGSINISEKLEEDQKDDSGMADGAIEMSLQRKIVHEPTRPDLWLSLAKQLVEDGNLEQARIAAERTSAMLKRQLILSTHNDSSSSTHVDSSVLSESLSLAFWLRQSSGDGNQDEGGQSAYDIQFALMMCPNDPLSREAFKLISAPL